MSTHRIARALVLLIPDIALVAGFGLIGYGSYALFGLGWAAIVTGALLLFIAIGGRIHAYRIAAGNPRGNS